MCESIWKMTLSFDFMNNWIRSEISNYFRTNQNLLELIHSHKWMVVVEWRQFQYYVLCVLTLCRDENQSIHIYSLWHAACLGLNCVSVRFAIYFECDWLFLRSLESFHYPFVPSLNDIFMRLIVQLFFSYVSNWETWQI